MEKPLWLEEFQCNIPSRFSEPLPMALPSLFYPVEQHPWLLRLTEGNGTEALLARQCHLAATLAPSSERRAARL